ncbi:hypothetical protein [Polaromonas sp.]|uniref:hypothetical protein n=1 Tax=Polaromonas sp. TaxID=1869339 RepID=UPI003BB4B410
MAVVNNLKRAICSLFEVHADEGGVQRVVTPLEYPSSNDRIVIRVRPFAGGSGFLIDENGEAAFYAGMNGGDIESEAVERWAAELILNSPASFTEDEKICAFAKSEHLVAPYVFRVAEAAQQLHSLATARTDRQASDFKDRLKQMVKEIAKELNVPWQSDIELPIAGGLKADHLLGTSSPLIIVAATSPARLLEAEVIYMQYRAENKPGYVLAVAENQTVVGKKQYERAAYYTNKAVIFNPDALRHLIKTEVTEHAH